jgi:tetratricopeptide (TPR) repeat protein
VGRLDDAEKAYRKALTLNPANPAPHFNLGVLLGDYQKDYDGAISAFTTYVSAGGERAELAEEYISDVEKEKKRAERRAKARADKAKRDAERAEKKRLLEEAAAAEEAEKAASPDGATEPAADSPVDGGTPEGTPSDDSPWTTEGDSEEAPSTAPEGEAGAP